MKDYEMISCYIVATLKTSSQKLRDDWKQQALEAYPEASEFINLAYQIACEN